MRKIKVITRHAIANYGSLFQSYATQTVLEEMGYSVEIIDYLSRKETAARRIKAISSRYGNPIKRLVYRAVKLPDELHRDRAFTKFRKKLLHLSPTFTSLDELQSYSFGDDILCAGSDQVWGYMPYGEIDPAYFLDFGDERNAFVAYSASLGRTDFDEEYDRVLSQQLGKFSFITIREPSGVSYIEKHTPYKAEWVLDPTLLLHRDRWTEQATLSSFKKPYILLYQLHRDSIMNKYVKELARKTGLKVIRISTSVYDCVKYGKQQVLKDPKKVLSLFRNAACVVTNSFHATVFSLIFNRRFVDFLPAKTHERITDLLGILGLSNRIVSEVSDDTLNRALIPIDYTSANDILDVQREESLAYIQEQLAKLEERQ